MTTCLDLHVLYGDRFKLRLEADGTTLDATPESESDWLLELPCRYGVVSPHGGDILAATITGRRIGQQVARLPCILSSRGDAERVVLFHVNDAEAVLGLLKPRRRRLISAEYQARLAAIGRSTRFTGAQDVETGGTIDATTEGGPTPLPEVADAKLPPGTESSPSRLGEAPAHAGGAGELAEGQDLRSGLVRASDRGARP